MAENSDPTKDSAFKKVVDYFLRTPPQPKPQKGPVNESPRKKGGIDGGDRRPSMPSKS
jgi:hypothetical protein